MTNDKKPQKILMVDDEEFACKIYRKSLEQKGIETDIVHSGIEMIEKLRENKEAYDVILLDIVMPEVDGLEALEAVRSESLAKNSIFIIFSNRTDETAKEKAKELDCKNFLIKSSILPDSLAEEVIKTYQENLQ